MAVYCKTVNKTVIKTMSRINNNHNLSVLNSPFVFRVKYTF